MGAVRTVTDEGSALVHIVVDKGQLACAIHIPHRGIGGNIEVAAFHKLCHGILGKDRGFDLARKHFVGHIQLGINDSNHLPLSADVLGVQGAGVHVVHIGGGSGALRSGLGWANKLNRIGFAHPFNPRKGSNSVLQAAVHLNGKTVKGVGVGVLRREGGGVLCAFAVCCTDGARFFVAQCADGCQHLGLVGANLGFGAFKVRLGVCTLSLPLGQDRCALKLHNQCGRATL